MKVDRASNVATPAAPELDALQLFLVAWDCCRALPRIGATGIEESWAGSLSVGEQQRVAFLRLLLASAAGWGHQCAGH
jgi:ABC-type uncharacterized transport system fused permease/ATPase subunit